MTHLWDVKHPYRCAEGNYDSKDGFREWSSWAAFMEEFGNSDVDYNFVWRWEWSQAKNGLDEPVGEPGDGSLELFMVKQRKAIYESHEIAVTAKDEPAVRAYLQKHWANMLECWRPLSLNYIEGIEASTMEQRRLELFVSQVTSSVRDVLYEAFGNAGWDEGKWPPDALFDLLEFRNPVRMVQLRTLLTLWMRYVNPAGERPEDQNPYSDVDFCKQLPGYDRED